MVPALRECPEDIPVLVRHFLRGAARQAGLHVRGVTVKALRLLTTYPWPGNVRELQHEIRRLVYLCPDGGAIDAGKLSSKFSPAPAGEPQELAAEDADSLVLESRWRELATRLIREALRRSGGRQVHAAKMLGISRNGLADKIKRFGIDLRDFRPQV